MKLILATFPGSNGKSSRLYTYTASDTSDFEANDVILVPVGKSKRLTKAEIKEVISGEEVDIKLSELPFPAEKLVDITGCEKVTDEETNA